MLDRKKLYCTGCSKEVEARLTDGKEIYPHRKDLSELPFWKCDTCGNYVGCHHKTAKPTTPLGAIPTPEIKKWRGYIHRILDPMWKDGSWNRKSLYAHLNSRLGYNYHTAEIKSVPEAKKVYAVIKELQEQKVKGIGVNVPIEPYIRNEKRKEQRQTWNKIKGGLDE